MGVDLFRPGVGRHGWTSGHIFWNRALRLARDYGWDPRGTGRPADWDHDGVGRWDGNYLHNEWQEVEADDARALAQALEAAVSNVPVDKVEPAEPDVLIGELTPEGLKQLFDPPPTDLLAFFSGASGRSHLKELTHFCRLGRFLIT